MFIVISKCQGAFYCEREKVAREQVRLASSPSRERSAFEKYYIKTPSLLLGTCQITPWLAQEPTMMHL